MDDHGDVSIHVSDTPTYIDYIKILFSLSDIVLLFTCQRE